MTKEEVKDVLSEIIEKDVIKTTINRYISIDDFIARFEGADLTHESLTSHTKCTGAWKIRFDSWKEQGLLN